MKVTETVLLDNLIGEERHVFISSVNGKIVRWKYQKGDIYKTEDTGRGDANKVTLGVDNRTVSIALDKGCEEHPALKRVYLERRVKGGDMVKIDGQYVQLTEKILLDNYVGYSDRCCLSNVNGDMVFWDYNYTPDCLRYASKIFLRKNRSACLSVDASCRNHPTLERIRNDYLGISNEDVEI